MAEKMFDPDTDKIQQIFPGLEINCRIGSGGQKIVFEARHPKYGRVALKLMRPCSAGARARIVREIEAASRLVGDEFAELYDSGQVTIDSAKVIYIYEELLEGQNLRQLLVKEGRLPVARVLALVASLLQTLRKTNRQNIVHRDIKPENIFLTRDNRIVLIDFGIARHLTLSSLTHDYALVGPLTPGYASPEQVKNEKRRIGIRTDIFLLGIVAYECLAGYNPFMKGCSDQQEVMERCLAHDPRDLSDLGFERDLSDFVKTCLQKHPNRRYSSPDEALRVVKNMRRRK